MNYWKITNLSTQNAKLIIATGPKGSKGILLKPGEFCVAIDRKTPAIDAQLRRKLITVEPFDNTVYNFQIGITYNLDTLNNMIAESKRMQEAKSAVDGYIQN